MSSAKSEVDVPPPFNNVLTRLSDVRHDGGMQFSARCPAHDDRSPSLSVSWGNGKVVLHDHAGCTNEAILSALGLKWSDLEQPRFIDMIHDYEDADGEIIYQVVKYQPKDFRVRRPGTDRPENFVWSLKGVDPVPFGLPELLEALSAGEDVYITEGETDALAMRSAYSAVATTNHGGAGKWTDDFHSKWFVGATSNVTIVADRDTAGYNGALKTQESLHRVAGIDARIVLPAVGKDARDHVGDHGIDKFVPVTVAELQKLAEEKDEAEQAEFDSEVAQALRQMAIRDAARREYAAEQASGLFGGFSTMTLREALDAPRESAPWLIENLQRAGHKAFLVAQYKAGKTTVSGNVVRSLVDNVPFLGRFAVHPLAGNVGVLDYELTEDDALDLYRDMGVENLDRIFMQSLRGTGFTLANESHQQMAIQWALDHDIEYLALDPFGRAMRGFGEENSNDDVRAFLMTLDFIAKEAGLLGVLLPIHTGRGIAEVGAERARGATVLDDDADARWILTKDNTGRRFFRAEGRKGVGVDEIALDFDAGLNRLTATNTTRAESAGEPMQGPVLAHVEANPGCSLNSIKREVEGTDSVVAAAVKFLVKQGRILVTENGAGKSNQHSINPDWRSPVLSFSMEKAEAPNEASAPEIQDGTDTTEATKAE